MSEGLLELMRSIVHGDGSVPEMYVSSQINVISTVQAMSRGTFTVRTSHLDLFSLSKKANHSGFQDPCP